MILMASPIASLVKSWREVLSSLHPLYEVDINDLHTLEICLKKVIVDVLIVDVRIFGDHGVTEIANLKERRPSMHVIVMTETYDQREEISAILFGAYAYCHAERDVSLLPRIVETVLRDELWVDRKFITRLLVEIEDITAVRRREIQNLDKGVAKLTTREAEIAEWVAKGNSNRKIAEMLNISERTVKAHLGGIFRKLGIHDRLQLAIYMNHYHDISPVWHKKQGEE